MTVARAARATVFPAAFQLVAAMNPCPCGYDGDTRIECRCSPERIARYRARISGPLLERIDMHLEMPRQALDFSAAGDAERSAAVAARVKRLRELQLKRQGRLNAALDGADLNRYARLESSARDLLTRAGDTLAMSARSYHKVIRLARTLADLDQQTVISPQHVAEAISLRLLDRQRDATRI